MGGAEIVGAAKQEHSRFDGLHRTRQATESLGEGGIQRVPPGRDVSSVDETSLLRSMKQARHQFFGSLHDAPLNGERISLSANSRLIVTDEPVSALDVSARAQVLKPMMDLQDEMGLI